MAVVIVKSAQITGRDASPPVLTNASTTGGTVRSTRGVVPVVSGDSITSKYLIGSVPSNGTTVGIILSHLAFGTLTAADIGLYQTTENGGAVVDADFYASAILFNVARVRAELSQESGVLTIANSEKRIWEQLGLAKDPNRNFDVVVTLTAAADAAGTVLVEVEYAL